MRLSKDIKAHYTVIGEPGICYFCQAPGALKDTTPSHRATEQDRIAFNGTHSLAEACSTCWSKIHRYNWIEGGRRYGVARGCMTLAQKIEACTVGKPVASAGLYVKAFDGQFVIPSTMIRDALDPSIFYDNREKWDITELVIMQPLLAMRAMSLPTGMIRDAFWNQIIPADDAGTMYLDRNNLMKYQKALGIDDVSPE